MIPTGKEKKRFVRDKFASVSRRYDLLNGLLSFYIDHYWRWVTTRELDEFKQGPILDLCAGTLSLSAEIVRQIERPVVAVDFCYEMLHYGAVQWKNGSKKAKHIVPVCGDGEYLPLHDLKFQGITVAFGVRNLSRPEQGLREMLRVLKPGGKLAILEFSRPKNPIFSPIYRLYLHKLLPFMAGVISGDKEAYRYLADSIQGFYEPDILAAMMRDAGFREVKHRSLTIGIVTLYTGRKQL
ncbi:MAG: ubiquinone/menaquinone biosynthesis methyltransferase [Deltaproteobacteria bacterium]|nr:ubiquinone/menaquinone biosynthesis methyltransferase [Deltaproteobacteria bacterium]MDL1961626.1 ubiquinone/menaquinone biosynthesis methyltransferase [Deltaproteobacteria bacterium]